MCERKEFDPTHFQRNSRVCVRVCARLFSLLQLCYLYAELYKQSIPKETRRIFGELHSTFMDRSAVSLYRHVLAPCSILTLARTHPSTHCLTLFFFIIIIFTQQLKVAVPDSIAADMGKPALFFILFPPLAS